MVACDKCHKELSMEELDAGFNSDMYESKICSICIKELEHTNNENKLSLENNEYEEE